MKLFWKTAPLLLLGLSVAAAADDADVNHPAYRGSPSAAGGTCCQNLGEVRTNIDRIDRQIIALIAQRGSYVQEAGRFKPSTAAVDDPHRVDQIITKMRALAEENHLSPDVAEATYRAMIASFTTEERKQVEQGSGH